MVQDDQVAWARVRDELLGVGGHDPLVVAAVLVAEAEPVAGHGVGKVAVSRR